MGASLPVQITVAICTYNRANRLVLALESLKKQAAVHDLSWELLLIDNNSSDETCQVAESFAQHLPLRYLFESEQGLSAARNRALREFMGDLLVFTDDDVVLDNKWLYEYASAAHFFPEASYFGGRILPLWNNDKPRWLVDPSLSLISGLLVHYDLGEENRWFEENEPLPFGANFALRRELVERLQPFRLDLGVKGGSAGRGEEAEYLDRARCSGARGAYLGRAACYHGQDPRRFRIGYLYSYGTEKGRASALMGAADNGRIWVQLQFAVKGLLQLLKGRGDRFRQCVINMGIQRGLMLEFRRGRHSS
jgi:glycosyltransferase involved in cell wall biosynthesis